MKTIMLVALVVVMQVPLGAQDDSPLDSSPKKGPLVVGLKAGANYANVYDTRGEEFEADAKIGFAGGVFVYIPIVRFIGFQPEMLYAQRGFRGSGTINGQPYKLTRTSGYLDVPLHLAIKPVRFLTIMAGPQYSYLLHQRDHFTSSGTTIQVEQEFDNDNIRENILAISGGVDIYLPGLVVSGRVGWDMIYNKGDGTSSTPRYKNVWAQATLGLRF